MLFSIILMNRDLMNICLPPTIFQGKIGSILQSYPCVSHSYFFLICYEQIVVFLINYVIKKSVYIRIITYWFKISGCSLQ